MSPNLESPVQTQRVVSVLTTPVADEYNGNKNANEKPVGRRRVFVQTETGCVFGIELDRSDNAHILKRKLQVALNVQAEESSLTFGDTVLKNDLSAVRKDSPLLLTRNFMHRSSSTPCISISEKDIRQRDQSSQIEIIGCASRSVRTKQLVRETVKAISKGVDPVPVHSGLGGAYYFRNTRGESLAIVKPTDEEPFAPNNPKGFIGKALGQPGLKRSVRVGETGFREVAAYLLDYDHFANVPPTALVKITHSIFNVNGEVNRNGNHERKQVSKIASFQQYIPHDFDASDYGTSSFPVSSVHRIGILDVRIFNTDRHGGNLLVKKLDGVGRFGQVELIPIDHGLCLPENLEDPYFEWVHWPQASIPFSEDELEYIRNLDPVRDSEMLRLELPMIREACLRVLVLCTTFLKEAAAFGLSLADIGEMMSREFRRSEEEPSELEVICMEAKKMVAEEEAFFFEAESGAKEEVQFDIDCDVSEVTFTPTVTESLMAKTPFCSFRSGKGRNYLSMLQESANEGKSDDEEEQTGVDEFVGITNQMELEVAKITQSVKATTIGEENRSLQGVKSNEFVGIPNQMELEVAKIAQSVKATTIGKENRSLQGVKSNSDCIAFTSCNKFANKVNPHFQGSKPGGSCAAFTSSSNKNASEGNEHFQGTKPNGNCTTGSSSGNISVNEQLAAGTCFVKLMDMNEEEWALFLEKFQKHLYTAFASQNSKGIGQRLRLGTSCQF